MKSAAFASLIISLVYAAPQGRGGRGGSSSGCSPLELIWARGTTESQSNFGMFVGDAYVSQLRRAVPGMTYYNVVYPASFGSSSPEVGVADTIRRLNAQAANCPNQQFVLGGYSQGAVVMHRAAVKLDPAILNRVLATTTFGDGGQQATRKYCYD
jgi:cutinase